MKKNYIKFKIFPVRGKKMFYYVMVFNDRLSMRMMSMNLHGPNTGGLSYRAEAITHSFHSKTKKNGKWVKSDCVGVVMFYKGGFGYGVVAHEMAHAVNYMFLNNKINFNFKKWTEDWKENDEMYATVLGYLNNQFWKKYNKAIKKPNLFERY